MKGKIETNRSITYRGLEIHEESYFYPCDEQIDSNWGVQYVINGLPNRKHYFRSPGSAIEFIDFYRDFLQKGATIAKLPGSEEANSGGA